MLWAGRSAGVTVVHTDLPTFFEAMQPDCLNKAPSVHKRVTVVTGRDGHADELFKCKCRQMVAVPYGGQANCPTCGHTFRWPSRYERPARVKVIQTLPIE